MIEGNENNFLFFILQTNFYKFTSNRFQKQLYQGLVEVSIYSGGKNKRQKSDFPYKIGMFKTLFRDKKIGELLNSSKGQTTYTRRT